MRCGSMSPRTTHAATLVAGTCGAGFRKPSRAGRGSATRTAHHRPMRLHVSNPACDTGPRETGVRYGQDPSFGTVKGSTSGTVKHQGVGAQPIWARVASPSGRGIGVPVHRRSCAYAHQRIYARGEGVISRRHQRLMTPFFYCHPVRLIYRYMPMWVVDGTCTHTYMCRG